jgi:aminoglycoside/choline kinase family phosphotransferase
MRDVEAFLAAAGWQDAVRVPLAGDMSPRRYLRLERPGASAILMDADDPQTAFRSMTHWLRSLGLSAPEILRDDAECGLLLLEDLGDLPVARLLENSPRDALRIYRDCIDLLLAIRRAEPPALRQPNAAELLEWTGLVRHYPGIDEARLAPLFGVLHGLLDEALESGVSVSLRDFHVDNLMWLPKREGVRRFGLLDYQDAFLTHPCYDLVSLLTDARTVVDPDLRETVLSAYLDRTGDAEDGFRRAFAAFAVQRNLRILGLFSRAGRRIDALPRVRGYVRDALGHPAFDTVRDATLAALPEPRP